MSSSLYLGAPGAGKTTALVRYVILPALERKQRVVTNVPLNEAAFVDRLGMNLDGLIRLVSSDEIKSPNFWFTSEGVGETITKGGDCIVIDEAHEFFGSDQRIKSDHEVFRAVRLQRKYTGGEANHSTSIVFATQVYEDICRSLRNVCDSMYFMQKLIIIGKPDSYRVDVYSDPRKSPTRGSPVNSMYGTYEPEYFKLYNSYSTGVGGFSSDAPGLETVTDDRLNIWNSKIGFGPFKMTMVQAKRWAIFVSVASLLLLFYIFYSILSRSSQPVKPNPPVAPTSLSAAAPGSSAPAAVAAPSPVPSLKAGESSEFRLVGFYELGAVQFAVVVDRDGRYRYLRSGAFSSTDFQLIQAGPATHIKYQGQVIAPWTGSAPARTDTHKKVETSK